MANVKIKLSQNAISLNNDLNEEGGATLGSIISDFIEISETVNSYYSYADSWSHNEKSKVVSLNYLDGSNLRFSGVERSILGASLPTFLEVGSAYANSRVITISSNQHFDTPLRETILGDLNYSYGINPDRSLLYYGNNGTISSYKVESLKPVSPALGTVSLQLLGNINYSESGLSGAVSKITSSASNFLPSETITGDFWMSSVGDLSSMEGNLTSYKALYKDKSYVEIQGSFYLTSDQSLDYVYSNEELWAGDDTFNVQLPNTLTTPWYMASGTGNDVFTVSGGNRQLYIDLGADDDIVYVNDTQALLNGGYGTDTVISSSISIDLGLTHDGYMQIYYGFENATLQGNKKLNITGNDAANTLTGNSGANIIDGAGGGDWMIGGAGNDTYVSRSFDDHIEDTAGIDTVQTYVSAFDYISTGSEWIPIYPGWYLENDSYDGYTSPVRLISSIENVTLMGDAYNATGNALKNTITGNNTSNSLYGLEEADVLNGLDGDDYLNGGSGIDRMLGGLGNDMYFVDNLKDQAIELKDQGNDTIYTNLTNFSLAKLSNVENLSYSPTLIDAYNVNVKYTGNASVNQIYTQDGNDYLDGGIGGDYLSGGNGDDTYIIDDVMDTISDSSGIDTIRTQLTYLDMINYQDVENIVYTGKVATTIIGNELDNTITSSNGNDILEGGGGSDTILGGNGNDTIYGFYEFDEDDLDFLELDELYSTQGSSLDILNGGAGNDTLIGGPGNDMLIGGLGYDSLTGGEGQDNFVFNTILGKTNIDIIQDFAVGTDKVFLDDAIFKKFVGSSGQIGSSNFVNGTSTSGTKAATSDQYLIYHSDTNSLFYDADGNGKGAMVQFATLTGVSDLAHTDFWIA